MSNISMLGCLYVFIGGGIGATMRYITGMYVAKVWGNHFPHGTLIINISGSFVMGLIAGYFLMYDSGNHHGLKLFLMVGLLGGFTTFSSFSLETLMLWQKGEIFLAFSYVLLSVIVSLAMVFLGAELIKLKFR